MSELFAARGPPRARARGDGSRRTSGVGRLATDDDDDDDAIV